MPKDPTTKYYAVLHGRGAPFVTSSKQEYEEAMNHFCGASGKGFFSQIEAQQWLDKARGTTCSSTSARTQSPISSTETHECRRSSSNSLKENSRRSSLTEDLIGLELAETQVPETPDIKLSEEQQSILNMVKERRNVFFTGPAGTGKSVLLRAIIQHLKKIMDPDQIGVTATTGIAAIAIGGRTIHSYAGIMLGQEDAPSLLNKVTRSLSARNRWLFTKVLIIDEVSMLDAQLFDKLEFIGRNIRDPSLPFGGIQLVVTGDFFQLPPVNKRNDLMHRAPSQYAFQAQSWDDCFPQPYFLKQIFRQTNTEFIDILSAARLGELSQAQHDALRALERPLICGVGVEPSYLFPKRKQVTRHNNLHLDKISEPHYTYWGMDSAGWTVGRLQISPKEAHGLLEKYSAAPEEITLKVGAQVMLIKNVEAGSLVNGSMGKVVDFLTVREAHSQYIEIAVLSQDKDGDEENKKILQELAENRRFFSNCPAAVKELYENIPDLINRPVGLVPITNHTFRHDEKWPLVSFTNGRKLLCAPLNFEQVGLVGNIEANRIQVPLILSWAISIHKSQGQTLQHVKVDFHSIFQHGQAYVALSRATSIEGLQIAHFDPSKITAHPNVKQWHNEWQTKTKFIESERSYIESELKDHEAYEEAAKHFWEDQQSAGLLPS